MAAILPLVEPPPQPVQRSSVLGVSFSSGGALLVRRAPLSAVCRRKAAQVRHPVHAQAITPLKHRQLDAGVPRAHTRHGVRARVGMPSTWSPEGRGSG
jgi:hypothetical protein